MDQSISFFLAEEVEGFLARGEFLLANIYDPLREEHGEAS